MTIVVLSIIAGLSLLANFAMGVMIRGMLATEEESRAQASAGIRVLTGKDIETIRRRLAAVGNRALKLSDAFSLILTIRRIQLGQYTDEEPWIPANAYEDVDLPVDGLPE